MVERDSPASPGRADGAGGPVPAETLRFYGEEFLFDTASGMFYRLSPTAAFIVRSLMDGADVCGLIDIMQKRYGIERVTASRDIELLLNDLTAIEPLQAVQK